MSELVMPGLPWFNIDEGTQRLRETSMLAHIYHLKPTHPHGKGIEDRPFTNTLISRFLRGDPAFLKSFLIAFFIG